MAIELSNNLIFLNQQEHPLLMLNMHFRNNNYDLLFHFQSKVLITNGIDYHLGQLLKHGGNSKNKDSYGDLNCLRIYKCWENHLD